MNDYGQFYDIDDQNTDPIKVIDRTFSFSRKPIIITQINNVIIQADPLFNAELLGSIKLHAVYCTIILFLLFITYRLFFNMKVIV